MNKREPLFDEKFFRDSIEYSETTIQSRAAKLTLHPELYVKPQTFKYATFRDRYRLLFLAYSAGDEIARIAARFPAVVDAYEAYLTCPGHEDTDFSVLDDYLASLWLLSFALIFDVDANLLARLLKCIGNEGKDRLFEKMAAVRVPGRAAATQLMFPQIFKPLDHATAAPAAERGQLVKQYLQSWYKAMKPAYWHDAHKGPQGGGFFGYWAVEVAGTVKAYELDDSSFREMPYYPKDLVGR